MESARETGSAKKETDDVQDAEAGNAQNEEEMSAGKVLRMKCPGTSLRGGRQAMRRSAGSYDTSDQLLLAWKHSMRRQGDFYVGNERFHLGAEKCPIAYGPDGRG